MLPRILVVAGSDSCAGAGIQADIKTAMALGAYAMTAITAVTVQNTVRVEAVHPIPADIVESQMIAVLDDIGADAIKTGMLVDAAIVDRVASAIEGRAAAIPLVVDPVMLSTSGTRMLDAPAVAVLRARLLPLATLLTPNLPEAAFLLGRPIETHTEAVQAAIDLLALGPRAILLKGGHGTGALLTDILATGEGVTCFESPRIETHATHGTGCTLATAIAVGIAQKLSLEEAVRRARDYLRGALLNAPQLGHGHGPMGHGWEFGAGLKGV